VTESPGTATGRKEGITLGRVAGVPVILAYSWFIVAAFIVLVYGPQLVGRFPEIGFAAYIVALAYAVLLLLSVLVHELAHALSARAFHWPTAKIVLTLWGGHTQFGNFSGTPGRSLAVALAGPAANFLLAGAGYLTWPLFTRGTVGAELAGIFVYANLLVAVFNVLPGLPLDGGRIVESAVWKATGSQEKGTVAAGWSGRIIAALLVLVVVGLPMLQGGQPSLQVMLITILVCIFLWMGASAAIQNARMRLRLPEISAAKLMHPAVSFVAGTTVAQVRGAIGGSQETAVVLVAATGQPEAVVDLGALAAVPDALADTTPVNAVARALAPGAYVPEAAAGQELIQYLAQLAGSEYAVINRQGQVTGMLHQRTVVAAITGKNNRRPGL
jgi:Zn-dependent protease